jgi:arsenate reductase (thioredoxin)
MAMEAKFQVLFLGTGNCARSIMAEALLDKLGRGRFHAHSAGSHPTDHVHPLALELIERMGFVEEDFRCKSWHEYTAPDAPELDMVITVCEHADREGKLKWPGNPVAVHWAVEDPLKLSQDEEILRPAFRQVFNVLTCCAIGSAGWWRCPCTNLNETMLRPLLEKSRKRAQQGKRSKECQGFV